VYKRKH